MPIQFVGVEGRSAPIIVCDHCEQRIRNGDGNAAYRYHEDNRIDLDGPYFIHKSCTYTWEREHPPDREPWLMDELEVWLGYLVRNAGYDATKLADAVAVNDYLSDQDDT